MIKNESVRRDRSREWRVKFLAGQDPILAEHFLFTGRYFELLVFVTYRLQTELFQTFLDVICPSQFLSKLREVIRCHLCRL